MSDTLASRIRRLSRWCEGALDQGEGLDLDTVRAFRLELSRIAPIADHLQGRADVADELEAIAADLDVVSLDVVSYAKTGEIGPPEACGFGLTPRGRLELIRAEAERTQADLQAALDAGDEDAIAAIIASKAIQETADLVLGRDLPDSAARPPGVGDVIPFSAPQRAPSGAGGAVDLTLFGPEPRGEVVNLVGVRFERLSDGGAA